MLALLLAISLSSTDGVGHVYGPDGRLLEKAEVRVVYPKTFSLVRTGEDGAYELPFERTGRFLVEAVKPPG